MKAAILDCGAELLVRSSLVRWWYCDHLNGTQVPNFVNIGDTVILRPSTSEFIKRVL